MKTKYTLFRRGETYYSQDGATGKQTSLRTKDETEARSLRQTKRFGLERIDHLVETREEFDEDFRRDYFEWHIQYHLGEDEKRAIARFCELLTKHGLGPVFAPKFFS